MLKIRMMRHGKTVGNTEGRYIGTTDEQLLSEEREALGHLELISADAVFMSPMKRCRETAACLFPDCVCYVLDAFRECDFGVFENKNYQELSNDPTYQRWIDSEGTLGFPGGENQVQFQNRCLEAFEEMMAVCVEQGYETVAMVVHGGTIMSIMAAYGIPKAGYFDWQVRNAEGYRLRVQTDLWQSGVKELIVDGKIIRGQDENVW